jgi:hypothetical protein
MATSNPAVRRRARLVRGPLTIGEPAAPVDARLAITDPYRPDTIADGGDAFGLTVRAASVRGLYKRYVGGPRQDDLCLRAHAKTRTLIAAVADGVSAAERSDLGAALAVRHACAAVARQLDAAGQPNGDGPEFAGDVPELDWRDVFDQPAWALVEEHRRSTGDPTAGPQQAATTLATTLVVAAVTELGDGAWRAQAAAVGDSPALLLDDGEFEAVVGDEADSLDGLLGGGVAALPLHARAVCSDARTFAPGAALLVCTDGLALPLGDGNGEVGRMLIRELARPPEIVDFARLLDFSRSTYDDDRTLVAVWPRDEP